MSEYKALKKIIVIAAIFIVLTFVALVFLGIEIKNKNQNISKLQNELVEHESESKYLNSIKSIVSDADTSIVQIDSTILKNDSEVNTIETIEEMATKNNLEVSTDSVSVDDLSNTKDSGITTLKIKVKTTGTWTNIYNFISGLEAFPYKIKIEKVSIVSNDSDSQVGKSWQAVIEIRLLKFK